MVSSSRLDFYNVGVETSSYGEVSEIVYSVRLPAFNEEYANGGDNGLQAYSGLVVETSGTPNDGYSYINIFDKHKLTSVGDFSTSGLIKTNKLDPYTTGNVFAIDNSLSTTALSASSITTSGYVKASTYLTIGNNSSSPYSYYIRRFAAFKLYKSAGWAAGTYTFTIPYSDLYANANIIPVLIPNCGGNSQSPDVNVQSVTVPGSSSNGAISFRVYGSNEVYLKYIYLVLIQMYNNTSTSA